LRGVRPSRLADTRDAAIIGNKVLRELAAPIHVERHELDISCSIGISVYPRDGKTAEELMVNADVAMYQAKKAGRNGYRFFVPEMSVTSGPAG
jgi:diguanylate cyclase (GGDEF)-like protein